MRAVVTRAKGVMELADVPAPGEPGPGEVIVRPQAVGICGSDFHFLLGEIGPDDGSQFPKIQGHEVSATVDVGRAGLHEGARLRRPGGAAPAQPLRPLLPVPDRAHNVCDNFSLIGIHEDGGFQEMLRMPEGCVFPTRSAAAVAALAEPLSIAVRAVNRSGSTATSTW